MEILEASRDRLVLVSRPWGVSLTYLAFALFWTWVSFGGGDHSDITTTEIWFIVAAGALSWGGFFMHAQRTEITFDRPSGMVRIARHRLFGRTGTVFPLAVLDRVTAQRVARLDHWPWQYRLVAVGQDEAFGQGKILVPGLMRETPALTTASQIAHWLDSTTAAA